MEHFLLTKWWFCWSKLRIGETNHGNTRTSSTRLVGGPELSFSGFQGSILVQRFFFIKNYSDYRIIGIEWNWTNCTSPLRTLPEVSGLQFQTTARRHIIDARVFALRTTPRKLSGFLVCMRRHRKRIRIWRTWTYQTCDHCLSASWKMSSSLGEDPTACSLKFRQVGEEDFLKMLETLRTGLPVPNSGSYGEQSF